MYNRYIPTSDGGYKKHSIPDLPPPPPPGPPKPPGPPPPPPGPPKPPRPPEGGNIGHFLGNLLPAGLDTEDLIVVLLLLLMSGDCSDGSNTALITMLIYLFL